MLPNVCPGILELNQPDTIRGLSNKRGYERFVITHGGKALHLDKVSKRNREEPEKQEIRTSTKTEIADAGAHKDQPR